MVYNIIKRAISVLIITSLPIVLLFTFTEMITYDMTYYKNQYNKYNIYTSLSIEENDLEEATVKLLDYIKGKRDNLNFVSKIGGEELEFFSDRDKLHMLDVRDLFRRGFFIRNSLVLLLIALLALSIFNKNIEVDIWKSLLISSIIGVLPLVFLLVLILLDFNKYFTIFHEVLFTNDLWLLDPNLDRLVNIFPEKFFSDTAIMILLYYFIAQLLCFVLACFKIRKGRLNNHR